MVLIYSYRRKMAPRFRENGLEMKDFMEFVADNIWLPIIAVIIGVLILILIVYCIWRRCNKSTLYDYTALNSDISLPRKLEMEKKLQHETMRETALLQCQLYLRSTGSYSLVEHLPEIGSRIEKHWFVMRDQKTKSEKLMVMLPRGARMLLPFTKNMKKTIQDLLSNLQHPYIYPMYELDLLIEQDKAVVFFPYNSKGSLKDIIYHAHCMDSWSSKYYLAGTHLPPHQISLYSRQILEGLLYLQKCGFLPFANLHSGNIILQNNTCRITGYENEFLGLAPKLYGMTRKLKDDKAAIETICFGHLVYEMAVGNELDTTFIQQQQLDDVTLPAVKEFLTFIFIKSAEGYHSIREIVEHPFVKDISLMEMQAFTRPPAKFTKHQKSILKSMKKGKPVGQRRISKPDSAPRAFPT